MKNFPLLRILILLTLMFSPLAHAEKTILVFGDSLSAGYGIARDASWVNLLQEELRARFPQYVVVNASISGETSSGGARRIAQTLQLHHPDIVILELGANDGLRGNPLSMMRKDMSTIITKSKAARARVLLVGMRLPPNYGKTYVEGFQNSFLQLAKEHHVTLLPFLLEGLVAEQFQADNLHPNANAQAHIKDTVMTKLIPMLSQ